MSSRDRETEVESDVEIVDVAHGGDGVGHLEDGRTVFVPRTLPGEVVDVEVVEEAESWVKAEVTSWKRRSDDRVEPACPYFERCGGCQYWHVSYARELELKADAAREIIERHADLELPEPEVHEAPSDRRYRSRTRFHHRRTSDEGSWSIGYFAPGSRELVEVDDCLVAEHPINEARRRVEEALVDAGELELRIETADDESAVVSIEPADGSSDGPTETLVEFAESLDRESPIRGVRFVGEDREWVGGDATVDGDRVLAESPVDSIRVPAGLFRQANAAVNRSLVERVRRAVRDCGARRVLELFCGVGNFSFPLGEEVDAVLGLEGDEVAVEMAQTMAEFAMRQELAFAEADLAEGLAHLEFVEEFPAGAVVLDPPRGGAREVCRDLVDHGADHLFYVSCDPGALGRDLAVLGSGGWRPQWIEMFDMFPRTSHVEVAVGLRRRE